MEQEKFGALKRVDLRLLWPHEALDFTPWLAQNLAQLGEVLGMDLELRLQEAPVGPFSLDLLMHDLGSDRIVIIENQLEPTDHDHLGKLLTYAAGHNAAVAVWIAAEFREEDRQALDWLNQRTDATTEFFGIVVEALQIDKSRPACNFRLVAFPNEWRKANVTAGTTALSPRAEAYRAFFQDVIDRLRTQYNFTRARKAQPNSWCSFSFGVSGIAYSLAFALGERLRVEIYFGRSSAEWNKWIFDHLYQQRGDIENALGDTLEWERLDAWQASRIALYRNGTIDESPQAIEEIKNRAIESLLRMKQVFGSRISVLASSVGPLDSSATIPSYPSIEGNR